MHHYVCILGIIWRVLKFNRLVILLKQITCSLLGIISGHNSLLLLAVIQVYW